MTKFFVLFLTLLLGACSSVPISTTPRNAENLCLIFKQQKGWYAASVATYKKWGVPIPVQMAIMHQESRFVADAKPKPASGLFLGVIPWVRLSDAYGYPQAKDDTWRDYQKRTGNLFAQRDNFADACDFIGWYLNVSNQKLGIPKNDTRNLYLSYHEGWQGFQKQTYNQKTWLLNVANKVEQKARTFQQQLANCR